MPADIETDADGYRFLRASVMMLPDAGSDLHDLCGIGPLYQEAAAARVPVPDVIFKERNGSGLWPTQNNLMNHLFLNRFQKQWRNDYGKRSLF